MQIQQALAFHGENCVCVFFLSTEQLDNGEKKYIRFETRPEMGGKFLFLSACQSMAEHKFRILWIFL